MSGGGGGGLEARVRELWVRLAQMEAEKIKVIVPFSFTRVADPEYVFGPPESGSISQRYGSGSFYHQAKIVRKTLIPTVL